VNFNPSVNHKVNKVRTAIQSLRQLGMEQVGLYAWYKLLLKSGWLKAKTPPPKGHQITSDYFNEDSITFPTPDLLRQQIDLSSLGKLFEEAEEISRGRYKLFGGEAVDLELLPPQPLHHWTAHEGKTVSVHSEDIKYLWEPARMGWAFILGRSYHISRREEFAESFWRYFEIFQKNNPPYYGPNWTSGQEVGLRILAMVFARAIFSSSCHSTPPRLDSLTNAIAVHAQRIPPTLIYARAQNNNHLFSEAVGLYTAGAALKSHPQSSRWLKMGWHWLNYAIQTQIEEGGTFLQHSTNYHRFILQAVLWTACLAGREGQSFPASSLERLAASTHWLLRMCVPFTGTVPNMGSNDGAYILPLDSCGYADYRPTLQAASLAFLGQPSFGTGAWDEMSLWLGFLNETIVTGDSIQAPASTQDTPIILHSIDSTSWAYLRAAHFRSRPGHADQLHLDLWWRGLNIAQDAGTFSYNAPPPWDNPLSHTAVHNTLTVNGQEQMKRAGRFLYLDWANAEILSINPQEGFLKSVTVRHTGYLGEGVYHQRTVQRKDYGWQILDQVIPVPQKNPIMTQVRLHWLSPDFGWQIQETHEQGDELILVILQSGYGSIGLNMRLKYPATKIDLSITRAGERLYGNLPCHPTWGWTSPTYGTKIPALSLGLIFEGKPPLEVISEWVLSDLEES
jgi:hypothetical protein